MGAGFIPAPICNATAHEMAEVHCVPHDKSCGSVSFIPLCPGSYNKPQDAPAMLALWKDNTQ